MSENLNESLKNLILAEEEEEEKICPLCFKKIEINLNSHFEKEHQEFECSICRKLFDSETNLNKHLKEDHDVLKDVFVCPICLDEFEDDSLLQNHVNLHFDKDDDSKNIRKRTLSKTSINKDHELALMLDKEEKEFLNDIEDFYSDSDYAVELEHEFLKQRFGMNDTKMSTKAKLNLEKAYKSNKIDTFTYFNEKEKLELKINSIYDDNSTCTKDLIRLIEAVPLGQTVYKRILCSNCSHYSTGFIDSGFGCGYRNTQMLLSSIRQDPYLCDVIFNNSNKNMPSVTKIQQLIEQAWMNGFDEMGKNQLGGILYNTAKWIGASDVAAMMFYLKINVELVDIKVDCKNKETNNIARVMFDFVKKYFEDEKNKGGFIHPIYIQHQGHSRTIVGVEMGKTDYFIIFDPAVRKNQIEQNLNKPKLMGLFRKCLYTFNKKNEYQLLIIRGEIKSNKEYQNCKVLSSAKLNV